MKLQRWLKATTAPAISIAISMGLAGGLSATAQAVDLEISFENFAPSDGFVLTPLWAAAHDGTRALFDVGSAASAGLVLLAETGNGTGLVGEFAPGGAEQLFPIGNPAGFAGAPVVESGETATATLTVNNTTSNRFFSYAAMVIPSNDAFIGNGDPTETELFDLAGAFNGPIIINIFGDDIYDAGSEENDGLGAAFSTTGGDATDTVAGTVALHPGLGNFIGTETAAAVTLGTVPTQGVLLAQIRIGLAPAAVSEPGTIGLFAASIVGLGWRRRRNQARLS